MIYGFFLNDLLIVYKPIKVHAWKVTSEMGGCAPYQIHEMISIPHLRFSSRDKDLEVCESSKVIILLAVETHHVGLILMNRMVTSVDVTKCLKKMKMTHVSVL